MLFFFFQAEDGIRDGHVTGVQTCALPIYTSQAKVPSRTGTPCGPARHTVGGANRSIPLVANVRARSSCVWARRWTATCSAQATVGQLDEARSRQNDTSGGARDTEVNEVAVNPAGGVPAGVPGAVTTVTVLAWWRSSVRNSCGSMVMRSALATSLMRFARWRTG